MEREKGRRERERERYEVFDECCMFLVDALYKFILDSNNPKFFSKRRSEIIKVLGAYVDTDTPEILILLGTCLM